MEGKPLGSLIDIAIEREEKAYAFYRDLYDRVEDRVAKDALEFLSNEEKRHREFLVQYRDGQFGPYALRMAEVVDNKIAAYLARPDIDKDMAGKDVYLVAAHREQSSYLFYKELALIQPAGPVQEMLTRMANEELKHKEKVEYLYVNTAFPQTAGG